MDGLWSRVCSLAGRLFQAQLGKVCVRAKWPIRPELIPVPVAWSDWEYFYSTLDGMLVHRRVTPSIKFTGTHLYTWVERGTVRIKCLAQEHNAMTPARARTRAARPETSAPTIRPPRSVPCWKWPRGCQFVKTPIKVAFLHRRHTRRRC